MSLSGVAQFILGFLIGVFLLTGAGVATAYWFFNRMSDAPSKPNFSEESSSEKTQQTKQSQPKNQNNPEQQSASKQNNSSAETASKSNQSENTASDPSDSSEPESEPTIQDRFGQQAYQARVTWPNGLSLRDRPSPNSSRVGGVYYDDKLVIIEKSSDGDWQKVYVPETGETAWVKAGNVEKIN